MIYLSETFFILFSQSKVQSWVSATFTKLSHFDDADYDGKGLTEDFFAYYTAVFPEFDVLTTRLTH